MPLKLHLPGNESDPTCCCGDGTDPGVECPDCDPATTGIVTLTNCTLQGNGVGTYPATPKDYSGTYNLAFPFPPTTGAFGVSGIHLFDDKIFYTTLAGSALVVYFYYGMRCQYFCNTQVPSDYSVLIELLRYESTPAPIAPDPPSPPYPGPYDDARWRQSGFIDCPPVTYDALEWLPWTPGYMGQYLWNVDLELT